MIDKSKPFGIVKEVNDKEEFLLVEMSTPKLKEDKLTKEQYENITKNINETNNIFKEIDKLRRNK
jgi:hypothetical protein